MREKERVMTKHLRRFDSSLSCRKIPNNGALGVYQRTMTGDHLIMPLTDSWTAMGRPVDWGIEPVLFKLRFGSPERDVLSDLEKDRVKLEESKANHQKSESEAFLKEWRPAFAKMTDGINTSTMEKIDLRRSVNAYRKS